MPPRRARHRVGCIRGRVRGFEPDRRAYANHRGAVSVCAVVDIGLARERRRDDQGARRPDRRPSGVDHVAGHRACAPRRQGKLRRQRCRLDRASHRRARELTRALRRHVPRGIRRSCPRPNREPAHRHLRAVADRHRECPPRTSAPAWPSRRRRRSPRLPRTRGPGALHVSGSVAADRERVREGRPDRAREHERPVRRPDLPRDRSRVHRGNDDRKMVDDYWVGRGLPTESDGYGGPRRGEDGRNRSAWGTCTRRA